MDFIQIYLNKYFLQYLNCIRGFNHICMEKQWQLRPAIDKSLIKQYPKYHRVILQLLFDRNLKEKEEIKKFLFPDFERDTFDPFLFKNMDEAVDLIISHIKAQNKIVVYGDYDADGVTATAVLTETLSILKAKIDIYIPHRAKEGYGLNQAAVKEIAAAGTKLIITVDSGIRNRGEVEFARRLGLDIIITDHHLAAEKESERPEALLIDPVVSGETYPFKKLAGVGVAFKVSAAVVSRSTLSPEQKKKLLDRLLDLTAVGTVADCVSLLGENRSLVKRGLEIINSRSRLGLRELIKVAGLRDNLRLNAWHIGFQLAPRLNAAGRLGHANTAFKLVTTSNKEEAKSLAKELNERNTDRQRLTEEITIAAEKQVGDEDKIIICVFSDETGEEAWNEGVIGLVAGRLAEKHNRPTLVITRSGTELKGSGRSAAGLNLFQAIEAASRWLDKYGGHASACGFSLSPANLEKFKIAVTKAVEENLNEEKLQPRLLIDTVLPLEEINEELVTNILRFEPFGQDNPRPLFASFGATIVDIITMGLKAEHIKLRLKTEKSGIFSAVGFGQAEKWENLRIGHKIDIVYYIEFNEFNGRREIQLKIIDIHYGPLAK